MKPFTMLAVIFLALIAVLQFLRFMFGWAVTFEGTAIPVWASGVAALIAAGLATMVWKESFGWHMPPAMGWFGRRTQP